ncbi:MAG: sulfatase-like hydrolase/transferase [Acidobacteria bacterium]|nr:sulfatase-like hydrolase/transferase [Acidobacteriota bacterium]
MSGQSGGRRAPSPASPSFPSRRSRSKLTAWSLLGALVLLAATWWFAARRPAPVGPIILISIDTLRADHLPAYGYQKVQTPAIDALAADGVLFERAYCHAPQTLPSHVSMLTGRLPFEHGVRDNIGFSVRPGERLISQVLREQGYRTAGVVSAYVLRKETALSQGFEMYDSELPPASPEVSVSQVQRDGAESVAVAQRWIDSLASSKFFLFLHLYEPHKPYSPPERYARFAPYDGEIAYSDELVGRFVRFLRDRGLYESATIVLLSDHGEGLGDHGELEHGVFLYDEVLRVPLVIKTPDGVRGRRVATPVQHIDLVPTLLDLLDLPRTADLAGRSLKAILFRGHGAVPEEGIYSESLYPRYHFGWSELFALTDSRYRFIAAPREELYDLPQDPREQRNLARERPATKGAMKAALDRLVSGKPIDTPLQVSPEDRQRLQALGYVGAQVEVAGNVRGASLPDPKDKIHVLEKYRRAVELAGDRRFFPAIGLLREILGENPSMADVWQQLANLLIRAGQTEGAVEAYRRFLTLKSTEPGALAGMAGALMTLGRYDEAADNASLAAKLATDPRVAANAHELLAKIALARNDPEAARREADAASRRQPGSALRAYVDGMILHKAGQYDRAVTHFLQAVRESRTGTVQLADLHYYAADTLARLNRHQEAVAEFREELRLFPQNTRAHAGLAMLYRATGHDIDAARAIESLIATVPTPEGYALAAKLWTIFGERARADAVRGQAQEQFSGAREPTDGR